MFESPIEEIKSKLDIVQVISSYLNLKKAGSSFKALCPFHSEKNPSFFVSPTKQLWHCFGCGAGGDIFKFIMLIEGVDFKEALRILAQRAGVKLQKIEPEVQTERKRLFDICELALKFFEKQMEGKMGQKVKEYLISRKISENSIKEWRIGWAPNTKNSLISFLVSKGFKKEEIKKAGLAFQKENGEFIDFFRGRIIFPIFDLNSRPIAFSGRIFLEDKGPKYINCPNTLLYDKGKTLYGLDKAKVEIKKKDFCLLVEGYTDTILAHQEGFKNTISVSGVALTPFQLSILERYTKNLYLCFDRDLAGDLAAKRGIDLARERGFEIKVLVLPEGKDPADIISENPKNFEEIFKNSFSIMEFYFQNAFSKFDKKSLEGKKEISKILLPEIKRIQNEIERSFWISKLASELKVKEEDLRLELAKIKIEEKIGLEEEFKLPQRSRKEILEERLLFLVLKSPKILSLIESEKFNFFSQELKEIFENLKKGFKFENLSERAKEIFAAGSLRAEIEEINEEKILSDFHFCLNEISKIEIKEKLKEISEKLKEAEKEKDFEKVKELSKNFEKLSQKLAKL